MIRMDSGLAIGRGITKTLVALFRICVLGAAALGWGLLAAALAGWLEASWVVLGR